MQIINQFNDQGNFIFWRDDIGGGNNRVSFWTASQVTTMLDWVLIQGKPFDRHPYLQPTREQWAAILGAYMEEIKHALKELEEPEHVG